MFKIIRSTELKALKNSVLKSQKKIEDLNDQLKKSNEKYGQLQNSPCFAAYGSLEEIQFEISKKQEEHNSQKAKFLLLEKNQKENFDLDKKRNIKKLKDDIENIKNSLLLEAESIESRVQEQKLALEHILYDTESIKIEKEKLILITNKKIENRKRDLAKITQELDKADDLQTIVDYAQVISGPNSESIRRKIDKNKIKQRALINKNKAWVVVHDLSFNNSLTKGKAMQKRTAKFLLLAFNAETDNLIGSCNSRNFSQLSKKIEVWFNKINKAGKDNFTLLQRPFLMLRLEELALTFEHKLKLEMETDEQRYIRDSLREESKVKREIEKFVIAREKEEKDLSTQIKNALLKSKRASDNELMLLKNTIETLQLKLDIATKEKQRALSMAQLTRSGHIYIISNEGSFGKGIVKIGMTRRLDPMDRVKELGDASVPFYFDVHGIIPSDDAPTLEKKLHSKFNRYRVNKVNNRREFFKVSLTEVESAINELLDHKVSLDFDLKPGQWHQSVDGVGDVNAGI